MSTTPFNAKMDSEQFMQMNQALRETGRPLTECYEITEAIHQAFFNQSRFGSFESFKKEYYRNHPTKK